jgi:hypothetical protein
MTEFSDRQIRLQRAGKKEYAEEEVRLIIEGAIQEEREACASLCKGLAAWHSETVKAAYETAADAIRARNLENLNKQAEANGEDL